ncbi:MAG: hypothetical protein ACI86H_000953, partial [bacterium]
VFVLGFISFYIPFFVFKFFRKRELPIIQYKISFFTTFVLFLVFNIISFLLRKNFQAGVPTAIKASSKIIEYSWYLFDYMTLIFLVLTIYKGLNSNSLSKISFSILSAIVYGLTMILLGWKSGFIWVLLFLFHILFFVRFNNLKLKKQTNRIIITFCVLAIFVLPSIFILGNSYRSHISSGKKFSFLNFTEMVKNSRETSFKSSNLIYIYNRITGISAFFPTVAYEKTKKDNGVSFWKNLLTRGSYQPETYFGCNILKIVCPPRLVTSFAPTGWGTFYIYNGIPGVIIGFLVLGSILAFFEYAIESMIKKNENLIALYTITYAIIFPAMAFEGTIVFFFKRHVLSFILAFVIISSVAVLVNKMTSKFTFKKGQKVITTE